MSSSGGRFIRPKSWGEHSMPLFCPDLRKRHITDLRPDELRALGVRGILLDADNTLSAHKSGVPAEGVSEWLEQMRSEGFVLMLASNAKVERIVPFAESLGLPCEGMCCKPLPAGVLRAAGHLKIPPEEIVLIGDQVFTDLLAGKAAGMKTVLVSPWQMETSRSFRIKRALEKPFLKRMDRAMKRKS